MDATARPRCLSWVSGRSCSVEELQRDLLYDPLRPETQQARVSAVPALAALWRTGLAGDQVAVWLSGESLTVAFADEPLAQYAVTYQPDQRHLAQVTEQQLFETPYRSPQLPLWDGRADDWLTVIRLPPYAPRRPQPDRRTEQSRLISDELLAGAH